jgi:hypothetical protein
MKAVSSQSVEYLESQQVGIPTCKRSGLNPASPFQTRPLTIKSLWLCLKLGPLAIIFVTLGAESALVQFVDSSPGRYAEGHARAVSSDFSRACEFGRRRSSPNNGTGV